jgi:hypothetical protein
MAKIIMTKISQYPASEQQSTIWILCPAGWVTGGPEALHQLARALLDQGKDARVVYHPERDEGYETPDAYHLYRVRTAPRILDRRGDIVVVPEPLSQRLAGIRHATGLIWWLSIENYTKYFGLINDLKMLAKLLMGSTRRPAMALSKIRRRRLRHAAQSIYARNFLLAHHIKNIKPLSDYLPDVFVSQTAQVEYAAKQDILVYNPKKGAEFTEKIMASIDGRCKFVPLIGLSREEVIQLLLTAKLYIDFGPHPGRDRIPREAALAGCCILVRNIGGAVAQEDMPIPDKYKVTVDETTDYVEIGRQVLDVLRTYDDAIVDFAPYRQWISQQKEVFYDEVAAVFGHGLAPRVTDKTDSTQPKHALTEGN